MSWASAVMSFFTSLMANVNCQIEEGMQAYHEQYTEQSKPTSSNTRAVDELAVPEDIKLCLQGDSTPKNYAHGPRHECQFGQIYSYELHPKMLEEKLTNVIKQSDELRSDWRAAWLLKQDVKLALEEHSKAYPHLNPGGILIPWLRQKSVLAQQLGRAEEEMQRVQDEMSKARMRGFLEVAED